MATTRALPKARRIALEALAEETYMVALYLGSDELDSYSQDDEASGPGYSPGGKLLPDLVVRDSGLWCKKPLLWPESSIEADGLLIYHAGTGEGVFWASFPKQRSHRDAFKVDFSGNPLYQIV